MPYSKLTELPEQVQDNLPKGAQEIYKEAYNNAYEQYDSPSKRRGSSDREATAHRVAWSAVKQKYEKEDGEWQKA
jgi:cation transport regulator